MGFKTKALLLISNAVGSVAFTFATPTLNVYFYSQVDSKILAIAAVLATFFTATVKSTIAVKKIKDLYRKHFTAIVIVDVIAFCCVCIASDSIPEVRFIGTAIINFISTVMWGSILSDSVNRLIDGEKLTTWRSISDSCSYYSALLGGILAIIITDLSVEVCLAIQCLSTFIMGIMDIKVYNIMDVAIKEKEGDK